MQSRKSEKGQALVIIVFGIIALVGITGLVIDGGNSYSDRASAQNAADAAALAGAVAHTHAADVSAAAVARASSDGYLSNGTTITVTATIANTPSGGCPGNQSGKDVTVQITSSVRTYFAPVLGVTAVTNKVSATSRSCDTYPAAMFNGNAIVGLAPTGEDFSAQGNPTFDVKGGGIFSNSSSSPSAGCGGNATVDSPSVTSVGGQSFSCHTTAIGTSTTGAHQYALSEYQSALPPVPKCLGTARNVGGTVWSPDANATLAADGSKVAFSGDMAFTSGLYCITNDPGPFHGAITGTGVTFYIVSSTFNMKFNGGGSLTASAATGSGPYQGVLMFSAPQVSGSTLQQTQTMDMRGNGSAAVTGSIIMPSADITMYGNSGTNGPFETQVIAYQVTSGGTADINVNYGAAQNYQPQQPYTISLIK
jgi:Flp pilus assembly protein TadG